MAVSNTIVKLKGITSKHEDCNLVFKNHGKADGKYPPRKENYSKDKPIGPLALIFV
jgi:hypothetical protein